MLLKPLLWPSYLKQRTDGAAQGPQQPGSWDAKAIPGPRYHHSQHRHSPGNWQYFLTQGTTFLNLTVASSSSCTDWSMTVTRRCGVLVISGVDSQRR